MLVQQSLLQEVLSYVSCVEQVKTGYSSGTDYCGFLGCLCGSYAVCGAFNGILVAYF